MSNQVKKNNLDYLIDPTFTKVNRLVVLSFKNEDGRTSLSKYFTPKVEIKDLNYILGYQIDFYFPEYKLAIKVDENGHKDKKQ